MQNATYAAKFLNDLHAQTADWPKATALYHSANPELGDPYQRKGTGPGLAKTKHDYTEPCLINAPTCTAQDGLGYGTKFADGKLWLAKLTDANKGLEDVCIITKLTGTSG